MPLNAYSEGASLRIPQQISLPNINPGTNPELWVIPAGFFGRWRFVRFLISLNAADVTFRAWFINVVGPSGEDCGQIIPGIAATGGGGGVTVSPIHEFMDASLPVLFDQVFQGGAGVQPAWDYSGMGNLWYPDGFSFTFDARQLVAGDSVTGLFGMVEIIQAEDAGLSAAQMQNIADTEAWLLHNA